MLGAGKCAGRAGWILSLSLLLGGYGLLGGLSGTAEAQPKRRPPQPHVFTATFVPEELPAENPTNIVEGTALLSGEGSLQETATCAGEEVTLRPYVRRSAYERELAGLSKKVRRITRVTTLDPAYKEYQKRIQASRVTTQCDAQGRFRFENVPNGIFLISTTVVLGDIAGQSEDGSFKYQITGGGISIGAATGVAIPEGSSGQTYEVVAITSGGRCEALGKHPGVSREDKAKWKCGA